MFTDFEVEVLENESDVIKNFQIELPKESASATKRAAKMAANNLFEDLDVDDIIVVGANKKDPKINLPEFVGGVGLTTGLDFSKLAEENPEWKDEPIFLATEEDLLFSKFFLDGDQNEETRNYRKNKKEFDEFDEEED
jgi:hypothetical protein